MKYVLVPLQEEFNKNANTPTFFSMEGIDGKELPGMSQATMVKQCSKRKGN
jgi:hypothetical protein